MKQNLLKFKDNIAEVLNQRTSILFLCLAVMCVGLYHEFLCGAFSVLLSLKIIHLIIKNKGLFYKINSVTVYIGVAVLLYLISPLWAVDGGVAIFGFMKILPVFLFLILCLQEGESTEAILKPFPYFVAIITVITAILLQFNGLEDVFSVAGRLAGTFQYSNTYAIVCLISLILLLCDKKPDIKAAVTSLILLFGILYSGSRTVLILTLITAVVLFFRLPKGKFKLFVPLALVVAGGIFILLAVLSGNTDIIERLTRLSLSESTFVGRLLYWQDVLPQVLKNPLGMGYMGYYFSQGSFQTGVYSVTNVHNDFLQLAVDIGWVPLVLVAVAIFKTLFSKSVSFTKKFALFIFCVHTVFDFNLQFSSVFMLFLLLLDWDDGEERAVDNKLIPVIISVILALVGLYFSVATGLQYAGKHKEAVMVYKYNTFSKTALLTLTDNSQEINSLADEISKQNETVSLAYSAKARQAYSSGDFENVIKLKKKAIEYAPYSGEEYEDYARMLIVGSSLYRQNGDEYSAEYCEKELLKIPDYIDDALENVSALGSKINDQPELELSKDVLNYIEEVKSLEN